MYRRGLDPGEDGVAFFWGQILAGSGGDEGFQGFYARN